MEVQPQLASRGVDAGALAEAVVGALAVSCLSESMEAVAAGETAGGC